MKKLILILFLVNLQIAAIACPVCERNKPKVLQGITHGAGPESTWEYGIVVFIAIIALLTLFYSVKWLIRPNESNKEHIKFSILNN